MWNLDHFVADCRDAVSRAQNHLEVGELMARAMSNPEAVTQALGVPQKPGLTPIYKSADLTILNVVWQPSMTVQPHDHHM